MDQGAAEICVVCGKKGKFDPGTISSVFFFLAGTAGGEGAETEDRVQTEQGAVAREQDEARAWSVLASIWLNSTGPRDFEKKPCTERLHIIYLCKSREKCAQAGVGVGTCSP